MEEKALARVEQGLPPAAQVYLSVWSMGVTPEGKALRVSSAARLAGVSVSTIKGWRSRIEGFRDLEAMARAASSAYTQRLARRIVEQLVGPAGQRLAKELQSPVGEWRAAWEVLKAAGGIAAVVDIGSEERLTRLMQDLRDMEDEEDDGQVADAGTEGAPVPGV